MGSLELNFYERLSMRAGEALFICRKDGPRLTDEQREGIQVPCIMSGDLPSLMETLTLLRIAELWEEAASFHSHRAGLVYVEGH
jgi:hypothetical protein